MVFIKIYEFLANLVLKTTLIIEFKKKKIKKHKYDNLETRFDLFGPSSFKITCFRVSTFY